MKGPFCGNKNTRVIDSRPAEENNSIRRRRVCDICEKRFTTYEKVETIKRLEGIVSVYLPDFKYGFDELGEKYSKAVNYVETAENAIGEMVRQRGKVQFDENGMITSGVIVRHLILPNHTKSSIKVLEIIKEKFGDNVLVSLMGQYIPMGKAEDFEKLNRKITPREYNKVLDVLYDLEIDGFAQELKSADKKFVPKWDI